MTKQILRLAQVFYGLALVVWGVQHFIFGTFRDVFFPAWQESIPLLIVWAWLFGAILVVAGVAIVANRRTKQAALIVAGIFLFFLFFAQIPYLIFGQPHKLFHLGLWVAALKESALAGGALILAYVSDGVFTNPLLRFVDRITPYGSFFFCATMICFGLSHILYADFTVTIVPDWIGDKMFWNYFAAIILMGSGIFILLDIRMRVIALLLAIALFFWVFMVHMFGAIGNPMGERGNQVASMLDALAFCGTSLMIAFGLRGQRWIQQVENLG